MDQELSATLDDERVIVGGDLNGHIGRSRDGIERIHGGWGMRDSNDEGENIVDTAMAFDLALVNTFFEKKVNQFVVYNSGGRESQIDVLMCRRCHLKDVLNCKVINGEAVAAQHRVLVMDWEIQRGKKRKLEQATPRIKWWRLREDNLKVQFKDLTRFNKIATQGAPQMAVDKEANSLSRVYSYRDQNWAKKLGANWLLDFFF